jgi:hypothetical protein
MKSGKLSIIIQVIFTSITFTQTYIPPGDVAGTWFLSNSPYYIQGDITIPNDSTLIIEPGVLVEFQGYYALNVQGQLKAVGDEALNITFTVNDTTGFYNPNTTLGGWNGIQFIDTPNENDTSIISYCTIQFGKAVGSNPPVNTGGAIFISNFNKIVISNSLISYNSAGGTNSPTGGGIGLQFASITLNDNEISHNYALDGGGIQAWESDLVFKNNNIVFNTADQTGGGIWIGGESNSEFSEDIISNNTAGGNGGGANFSGCGVQSYLCDISDNSSAGTGGGINAYSSVLEINNTNFERDTSFIFGGAIESYNSSIIINGCNLIDNGTGIRGGGIHSTYDTLYVSNTTFERDTSNIFGGAIATENTEIFLSDCILIDNRAGVLGGGIHSDYSNLIISNTSFERDTSGYSGGGVFTWLCDSQVNNCDFIENSVVNGGGAISSSNSDLLMDSCWFYQNSAQNQGGALEYIADTSGFVSVSQLKISNSTFEENSASTRCGAALIEQYNSNEPLANVSINNCEFKNNDALRVGALRLGNISNFILSNSTFIGNTVTQHTAACTFALYTSGYVYNCVFADNVASGGTSGGAGVSNNSNVGFMNCTFVNNTSGSGGGLQLRQDGIAIVTNSIFWGNYPDQISLDAINDTSTCILYSNYNDIQYGVDSIHINDTISVVNWGVGNIDAEPLFADTLNNDFHLQDLSPCIANGIDSIEIAGFWHYSPLKDIEGNPRPNPAGTMPDMGAYESEFPVRVGDENLGLPKEYTLYQNYPNPFNPSTTIKWEMPEPGLVTLIVYDVLGRKLTMLVNEELSAGKHEVVFDASRFSSGIYFYQLKVGEFIQIKKMILIK